MLISSVFYQEALCIMIEASFLILGVDQTEMLFCHGSFDKHWVIDPFLISGGPRTYHQHCSGQRHPFLTVRVMCDYNQPCIMSLDRECSSSKADLAGWSAFDSSVKRIAYRSSYRNLEISGDAYLLSCIIIVLKISLSLSYMLLIHLGFSRRCYDSFLGTSSFVC